MTDNPPQLRLGLPKGRMNAGVLQLLTAAGMPAEQTGRDYRPRLRNGDFDVKLLKPQNVVTMLGQGSRDLGFAGVDWVRELDVELVELLDLELDPVQVVAAAPPALLVDGELPRGPLRVASEYVTTTERWIADRGLDARVVPSRGATEAFPPEDADLIVDNTATGATLRQNGLAVVEELSRSTTRLFANPQSYADPDKRAAMDALTLLLKSVLAARARAMLDVNVPAAQLDAVIDILPAMQRPTIASLHSADGFAVRAAVRREDLPTLLPRLRARGARDLVVTPVSQLVP